MPIYKYRCQFGCEEDRYLTLAQHELFQRCRTHNGVMDQVITAPLLVAAQPECRYTSPIDDAPITSWAARRNDLAKHGCREYDPGMKDDYHRHLKESEDALDKQVDEHVERTIERMPTKERGKLFSELTEQGVEAQVVRGTYTG